MHRRQRVVTSCEVRFERLGREVVAESEDISENGVFVRTDELFPAGEIVELTIILPPDVGFHVIARVVHLLAPSAARALGRHTGMGFEFLDQGHGRDRLLQYLADLIEEVTPPPQEVPRDSYILVAEPSRPLRERLAAALASYGFVVDLVANGADAYRRCSECLPDVLVSAIDMPVMDGWALVKTLNATPGLRDIPVMFVSEESSDIVRLQAYRLGVKDFLHRPFTDEEMAIRLRRLVMVEHQPRRSMLRGTIGEISVATLLSLLEFERKSGILVLLRDMEAARLFVALGRIVKVEGPTATGPVLDRLMSILDWEEGNFEFTICEVVGTDEVGVTTTHLLLQHARLRDEGL